MELTISEEGWVTRAHVLDDPGNGFGLAAAQCVRQFRFSRPLLAGKPASMVVPFVLHFVAD